MALTKKYYTKFPESVLEEQTCTVCKKYLSCYPVKNYYTGDIKCGRCSKKKDFGVVSHFNEIAKHIEFPCANRYEGCPYWLGNREVLDHESKCKGSLYMCPVCPIGKKNEKSVLALIDHFQKFHKKFILNNPLMQINIPALRKEHYLYYNPHLASIFLIYLRSTGNNLSLNISTVGKEPELIKYRVRLFKTYPEKLVFTSMWMACTLWDTNLNALDIYLRTSTQVLSVEFQFEYFKKAEHRSYEHVSTENTTYLTRLKTRQIKKEKI